MFLSPWATRRACQAFALKYLPLLSSSRMRFSLPWLLIVSSGAMGPELTAWQQRVFNEVTARAAELSEAAEPRILAIFDSQEFRAKLASCCPSLVELPARALLEKLSEQLQVAEVVSGFPAAHDPADEGNTPGMSISLGLEGSFFLNDWEAILLHSKDPQKAWHQIVANYKAFSVDHSLQEVKVQEWLNGCSGMPMPTKFFTLDQCYRLAGLPVTMRLTAAKGLVQFSAWTTNTLSDDVESYFLGARAAPTRVPCPATGSRQCFFFAFAA